MKKRAPRLSFRPTLLEALKDSTVAPAYLEEALADGNVALFTAALKDVADARVGGLRALAKTTALNREQLYRTLSRKGNPRLATLTDVLDAVGLRMAVVPKD